ncbi:MAG TPA: hypothetical protein IGS53_18515 [Leptolyngbyaceae cyanobacterium M33_DOE_097]|uniref:Uncharacterized protein n=1 Tax=Oscillatoriales cyanobacterium SpSt-418 TaxID=2282169 RepID=A0A7C3KBJ0_9CYAN|nr:hypothetical protein [Leptolyngbyaceae cyanobacterium M33_DOE_097]
MKANTFPSLAPFILKVAGGVTLLLYLMDLISLLLGARFQEYAWILEFTTRAVDRGFIPLIGIALLFTGFWLEGNGDEGATNNFKGVKLAVFLIASLLGLFFLGLVPLHVSTTQVAQTEELNRIGDRVKQVEAQLNNQVQQQLNAQLGALDQAIASGQLPAEQLKQAKAQQAKLKKFQSDPKALEAEIAPERDKKLGEIRGEQQKAESQVRQNALRSGLRIGLGSLLLAASYAAVGWTGLRRMLS